MRQRHGAMSGRSSSLAGSPRSARLWLGIGGVILVAILVAQVSSGLLSPGSGEREPSTTAAGDATTAYLAEGYAQLNRADQTASAPSFWGLWAGMLLPLAIVIVAVYAILRGLRYVNARVATTASQSRHLESLDTLSLGQHGAIHLIRVGSRLVVVGAGSQQISYLAEVEPEQAEELLNAHRARQASGVAAPRGVFQSFRDLLQSRMVAPASHPAGAGAGILTSARGDDAQEPDGGLFTGGGVSPDPAWLDAVESSGRVFRPASDSAHD